MPSIVSTRARSNLLAITRTSGREALARVGKCACTDSKDVVAVLTKIGMPHAAKMHEKGELPWNATDWLRHAREEDERLFPLLLSVADTLPGQSRIALQNEVAALKSDHVRYIYPRVMRGELPPEDVMVIHGGREDALVRRYTKQLLRIAKKAPIYRSTFVGRDQDSETNSDVKTGQIFAFLTTETPWNLDTHGQKFFDPWITQNAERGWHTPNGREYLVNVATNGASRVDAMQAKIDGPAGDNNNIVGIELLKLVGETLKQRIDAEAFKTRASVFRGWDYMAAASGNFWVQVAGKALQWAYEHGFDPTKLGASAKGNALVSSYVSTILNLWGDSIEKAIPYPWHAFEALPLNVTKLKSTIAITANKNGTADDSAGLSDLKDGISDVISDIKADTESLERLSYIQNSLQWNLRKFEALPSTAQQFGKAWWILLISKLGNPVVARMFAAMHGNEWGAWDFSSDEQVMAVATPIAIEFGIPVRALAIELWNRSPGWSGKPHWLDNAQSKSGLEGFQGGDEWTPRNATQVQWCALAHDAFVIARAMRDGNAIPENVSTYVIVDPVSEQNATISKLPLILGAIGSFGLFVTSASTLAIAAPLVVGAAATYVLSRE